MFRENTLLDLGDDFIGVVQHYEHDRGGHTDPFLSVFSASGEPLWSFFERTTNLAHGLISRDRLWLLHSNTDRLRPAPL